MTPLPKLAAPARRALAGKNVWNLEHLAQFSAAEIAALHGMGPNAMAELEREMQSAGVRFKDS